MIRRDHLQEGRWTVDSIHEGDRRVFARSPFEVAAQGRIGGKNRNGDRNAWCRRPTPGCAALLHSPVTGRSPMTILSAVGDPPRINPRSTLLPTLSGPSSRMTSRTRAIG